MALGGAVIFGTAVGSLRVVFGRHFVSDIVFAGLITIAIVFALYKLLIDPLRRNDARFERGHRARLDRAAPGDRGLARRGRGGA
ncbi:MAG: PAP2 family protein, partial [Methyloceanibacter sp.]